MGKIPVITSQSQLIAFLNSWQRGLKGVVQRVPEPEIPWNFQVTSKQGGNELTWGAVEGADGYVYEWNYTGDFESGYTSVNIPDGQQTSFFDATPTASGAAPTKRYYRLYATAGTSLQPQSVKGNYTQILSATGIAPNDTATASVSQTDTFTSDEDQSWYRGRIPF